MKLMRSRSFDYLHDTLNESGETQTPCLLQFASSLQAANSLQFVPMYPG